MSNSNELLQRPAQLAAKLGDELGQLRFQSRTQFAILHLGASKTKELVVLVTAAAYLAATFLGQKTKLRILCEKLLIVSQRFFGIPPLRFSALADGIKRILAQTSPNPQQPPPASLQMELLLAWQQPKF